MNPIKVYKFCPRCAAPLEVKGSNFLSCTQCKKHLFINASATVGIIIENDKGEILLTKRAFDPGKGMWDLPGGFIMPNETLDGAAVREAKEELGVLIKTGTIFHTQPTSYLYQEVDVPLLDIFITATIQSGELNASDDVESIKYIPKNEVIKQQIWSNSIHLALEKYITQ